MPTNLPDNFSSKKNRFLQKTGKTLGENRAFENVLGMTSGVVAAAGILWAFKTCGAALVAAASTGVAAYIVGTMALVGVVWMLGLFGGGPSVYRALPGVICLATPLAGLIPATNPLGGASFALIWGISKLASMGGRWIDRKLVGPQPQPA